MESNTIERLQKCEREILQEIDRICCKYELRYFAIGGTALGALRHEGIIPWDDDIDIGMPREDYEKFLKVAAEELSGEYHIQNFFTEPKSPFYFTKIRKNHTRFVEYYLKDYDIHHGVFVDIFPFDHVPDQKAIQNIHFYICRFLYQLYLAKSLKTVCSSRFGDQWSRKLVIRKLLHYMLIFVPKSWLFHVLNYSVQIFNSQDTNEISHVVRRRLRVWNKDLYPITRVKFDDMQIPVPHNCDAYLKAQFGNYEVLPPLEKRYGHLPYEVELDVEGE